MLWLGGVVGASLPVGPFDLSLEVLGGFRAMNPDLEFDDEAAATKALGGCWLDANQKQVCPGTQLRRILHAIRQRDRTLTKLPCARIRRGLGDSHLPYAPNKLRLSRY